MIEPHAKRKSIVGARYCVTCKWSVKVGPHNIDHCTHELVCADAADPVTGVPQSKDCLLVRLTNWTDRSNVCGPTGKLWEPKP